MTLQDIITNCRTIIAQVDTSVSNITDATIIGFANQCTLQLCSNIATLPKESISGVVAAQTLTLSKDLLKLDFASISDGTTHYPLDTTDFPTFIRNNPNWENQTTGKPTQLVRMTNLNWMMFPAPDSTWTGKAVSIYGSVVPTLMSNTTDEPAVSQTLHPAYEHFCAYKCFGNILNNPASSANEYAIFDGIRKLNIHTATNTRGSMLAIRFN